MAIALDDLLKLRSDKARFARLDGVLKKRDDATKAIEKARADLNAAAKELGKLGITVDDVGGGGGMDSGGRATGRRRGRPPGSKNKPKTRATGGEGGSSVGNGRRGKAGAKRGPKAGGARRAGEDYQKALDAVGAEIGKADGGVPGPDIVAAMAKRGFKSKQVVMIQLRANKGWTMKGVKRGARYFYKG